MSRPIAFVGMGAMGKPMAENLLGAGFDVSVFNRTPERAEALAQLGARVARSPADAVSPGGVLITMLSDDASVRDVAGDETAAAMGSGGIHLSMSTIAPRTSRELAAHHGRFGVAYVAAPVFGRPEAAAAMKLWIACSGPATAKEAVRAVLEALGQGIFDFGEDPGAAHAAKLAGNLMIQSAVESLAEALALCEKQGVAPRAFYEMITSTLFPVPVVQGYGKSMVEGTFEPAGFKVALALKDERLVVNAGAEGGIALPLAILLRDRLEACVSSGLGEMDLAALYLESKVAGEGR